MSKSSKSVSVVLAILMLLVGTSTALAGPPTNTHQVIDGPVSRTLPLGQCAAAPDGVRGSGDRHMVTNTRTNPDGSMALHINDVVRGTAQDLTGPGTYNFVYQNHSVERIPAGAGAHQVSMEDNFVMNGDGTVGHLTVGFNWRWTYTPPAPMWPPADNWQQINTRGDPFTCDPI